MVMERAVNSSGSSFVSSTAWALQLALREAVEASGSYCVPRTGASRLYCKGLDNCQCYGAKMPQIACIRCLKYTSNDIGGPIH